MHLLSVVIFGIQELSHNYFRRFVFIQFIKHLVQKSSYLFEKK